jgi:hypothetical protein
VDQENPDTAEQPPELAEVQKMVARRRSGDPLEPNPNRGRAWAVTMVKAEPGQSPGRRAWDDVL